jgi:hypothetical protein
MDALSWKRYSRVQGLLLEIEMRSAPDSGWFVPVRGRGHNSVAAKEPSQHHPLSWLALLHQYLDYIIRERSWFGVLNCVSSDICRCDGHQCYNHDERMNTVRQRRRKSLYLTQQHTSGIRNPDDAMPAKALTMFVSSSLRIGSPRGDVVVELPNRGYGLRCFGQAVTRQCILQGSIVAL